MTNCSKKLIRVASVGAASIMLVFSAGCASIVHGGSRNITVNSEPPGAKATIRKAGTGESVHSGTTPLTVSLEPKRGFFRGQSYDLELEMEGYQSTEVAIRSELSGWYFGNIIFGGLVGMLIVDPATGSMWNLSPENIDRELTSDQANLIEAQNGFLVVLVEEVTEVERSRMVRIN